MTLFFNLQVIEKASLCNPIKYLNFILRLYNKQLMPKNRQEINITKMVGNSFLLNPSSLLLDKITDIHYKIQYIKLAGMRDYSIYKLYGTKSLPISYFPDIDTNSIKYNPLLEITQTDIHFKYER